MGYLDSLVMHVKAEGYALGKGLLGLDSSVEVIFFLCDDELALMVYDGVECAVSYGLEYINSSIPWQQ
jgi:hypothetical protein